MYMHVLSKYRVIFIITINFFTLDGFSITRTHISGHAYGHLFKIMICFEEIISSTDVSHYKSLFS